LLKLDNQILDISEIEKLVNKLCNKLSSGDVILLQGELGAGKTTLARIIINNLHLISNKIKPKIISSPTYPILITYDLKRYEIYHYDLYRIRSIKELDQLGFFENISKSITIVEWPELLIDLPFNNKHYLINLEIYSDTKRNIKIKYFE
tara:strand:- start:97 stop:543 length:447 start_codon:yes stop_codon:yes gene_type:complete